MTGATLRCMCFILNLLFVYGILNKGKKKKKNRTKEDLGSDSPHRSPLASELLMAKGIDLGVATVAKLFSILYY